MRPPRARGSVAAEERSSRAHSRAGVCRDRNRRRHGSGLGGHRGPRRRRSSRPAPWRRRSGRCPARRSASASRSAPRDRPSARRRRSSSAGTARRGRSTRPPSPGRSAWRELRTSRARRPGGASAPSGTEGNTSPASPCGGTGAGGRGSPRRRRRRARSGRSCAACRASGGACASRPGSPPSRSAAATRCRGRWSSAGTGPRGGPARAGPRRLLAPRRRRLLLPRRRVHHRRLPRAADRRRGAPRRALGRPRLDAPGRARDPRSGYNQSQRGLLPAAPVLRGRRLRHHDEARPRRRRALGRQPLAPRAVPGPLPGPSQLLGVTCAPAAGARRSGRRWPHRPGTAPALRAPDRRGVAGRARPLPAGGIFGRLWGVSCSGAGRCTSVGWWGTASPGLRPLAERRGG